MSKDQLKFTVISRLLNGESCKDISDSTEEVAYSTVLRWNRELAEARENDAIDQLIDIDQAMLGEVLNAVSANVPEVLQEQTDDALAEIAQSKKAIDVLQNDLIVTAKALNTRVKSLSLSVESISELNLLADTLCALQNAFFNKNTTQVNVQNNYGESKRYSTFLGDKPQ